MDEKRIKDAEENIAQNGGVPLFQSKVAPEQIATIYRSAKTPDEKEAEEHIHQQYMAGRVTKFTSLKIALLTSVLLFLVLGWGALIETMWWGGGMGGIFFSFAFLIILMFIAYGVYSFVGSRVFWAGKSIQKIGLTYLGVVGVLIFACVGAHGLFHWRWSLLSIISLTAMHLLITWALFTAAIGQRAVQA